MPDNARNHPRNVVYVPRSGGDSGLTFRLEVYILQAMGKRAAPWPDKVIRELLGSSDPAIYRLKELQALFDRESPGWAIPKSRGFSDFLRHSGEDLGLTKIVVPLPHRKETRYVFGSVSSYALAVSLKPRAYLSHYSALHLHGLTDQVPDVIYVNHEQRPQPRPLDPPNQERIDRAFAGKQRMTSNIAELGDGSGRRVCLLNGKHTENLGVEIIADQAGSPISVAGIERALIDAAVRPVYAGGVSEVLDAFRRASDRVSLGKLSEILKKLDYAYPYHQTIGFYLDRSGKYDEETVYKEFGQEEPRLKFYLTYSMMRKKYSEKWAVYYPAEF